MLKFVTSIARLNENAGPQTPSIQRLSFASVLGTTGLKAGEQLCRRVPAFCGSVVAIDGEVHDGGAGNIEPIVIPDAPVDDFHSKRDRHPILAADPLIAGTLFPHDTEKGAGTCPLIGLLKGAFVLDSHKRQVNRILRRRLSKLENPSGRVVVDAHIVAAAGGGVGSALIIPVALTIRDEVRRISPGARCHVIVHLFLAGHFDDCISDELIRRKVRANDYATFLELNWAQDPSHVAPLYELLGCHPQPVPTVDRLIPYDVADERGSTLPLDRAITDRLIPNIIAGENAGLANRTRELASNTAARDGARRVMLHPMVSTCQAAEAKVPPQLGPCWAIHEALKELAATLAKPSPERLKAFEEPAKRMLGIESMKSEVARVCGETLSEALTIAKTTRRQTSVQAHQSLTESNSRYQSAVRPGIEARLATLARHHDDVAILETLNGLVESLVDRGAAVSEVVMIARSLERGLVDLSDRVRTEEEKAAAAVKLKRDEFTALLQKLSRNSAMAGSLKERAATALNDLIKADSTLLRHRGLRTLVRRLALRLSDAAHEYAAVHREALRVGVTLKRTYAGLRELATVQTTTFRSVIKSEEFDPATQRLDAAIRARNDSLPALDVKGLIAAGRHGVPDQVDALVRRLDAAFDEYSEAHLPNVASTVKALRLSFSVQTWIEDTVRNLACCSSVRMSAAPSGVETQTTIVAAGDDLDSVRQALARKQTLAHVEVIPGSELRSILINRRTEGLSIQAIPSWIDSRRAAEAFPKPKEGLTAWENLAKSGLNLAAYEQEGLVPESWITPTPQLPAQRRAAKPVGNNGVPV